MTNPEHKPFGDQAGIDRWAKALAMDTVSKSYFSKRFIRTPPTRWQRIKAWFRVALGSPIQAPMPPEVEFDLSTVFVRRDGKRKQRRSRGKGK
jgi:hypothetical protein